MSKVCTHCLREKPVSAFYTKPTGGLVSRCKECLIRINSSRRSQQRAARRERSAERPTAHNHNPTPLIRAMSAWRMQ